MLQSKVNSPAYQLSDLFQDPLGVAGDKFPDLFVVRDARVQNGIDEVSGGCSLAIKPHEVTLISRQLAWVVVETERAETFGDVIPNMDAKAPRSMSVSQFPHIHRQNIP